MNRFVYLDNNATTKVSDEIAEKLKPFLTLQYGNPSSLYSHGVKVKNAISVARQQCASLINCNSKNIVFTSGGSEGNCAAINSAINQYLNKTKIVTTKVEHSSVLEYCELLQKRGYQIVYLDVDKNCNINANQLIKEVDDNTACVFIQYANNEVGTLILNNDIVKTIKNLKSKYDFVFCADCVQGLGKSKIDVKKLGVDLASFSGHKIHATKGIGMLYVKEPKLFTPLIAGHQEFGLRGGTENVLGIVAMGAACEYINQNFEKIVLTMQKEQLYLEAELSKIKGITINGKDVLRMPNTTSITLNNVSGNKLMFMLENYGICVSTGSACNSGDSKPSYVLTSMSIKNPQNTIRISTDNTTTNSQIDYFVDKLKEIMVGR